MKPTRLYCNSRHWQQNLALSLIPLISAYTPQPMNSFSCIRLIFPAIWQTSRGKMNTHRKWDTLIPPNKKEHVVKRQMLHILSYASEWKKNTRPERTSKNDRWKENLKKPTFECVVLFFGVISVLISHQSTKKKYKRIIGIAEFKGGLLMKITLYLPITPPLYHVTHTKFIWLSREHSIDTYDLCECVRSL